MKKSIKLFSCLLIAVLVLTACGSGQSATAPTTETANFPTGKFIKSGTDDHGYIFNADGTWSLFDGMFTVARGTYSVDGNVYTETSNDASCGPVMRFTYVFDGTNLTFNYVGKPEEDTCVNRTWDMNNVTYVLSR